jgi:hypothetical protein
MGPMQPRYNVYAPKPFIFGQGRMLSDIFADGRDRPANFWTPHTGEETVLILECPKAVVGALRGYGVHTGYDRNSVTDLDNGLDAVLKSQNPQQGLVKWLNELQNECTQEEGLILGVWHPRATKELLEWCWSGPIKVVTAETLQEALTQLPELKGKEPPSRKYVILLRSDKQTAGMLRGLGWHMGNWRDEITDQDNGLRFWEDGGKKPETLRGIVEVLVKQAEQIRNGVACIWHAGVTAEMLRDVTNREVIEIEAGCVEDAVLKWNALSERDPIKRDPIIDELDEG